jgi:uncharacterized membrane protein (UPF0127 family)
MSASERRTAVKRQNSGIVRVADGVAVCEECVVADRFMTRLRGLLGRRGLERGEGLLIRPSGSVHTWCMRFAIDVVLLDRDLTVLKVVAELRPWRVAAARGAKAVLELRAGECERLALRPGDVLAMVP